MRKTLTTMAVVVAATLMPILGQAGPATAAGTTAPPVYANSTTYQVNAAHNGVAGGSALPSGLASRWSTDLGGKVSYPVIASGRVFVTATHADGSYGSDLYAFSVSTGKKLWGPVSLGGTYFISGLSYAKGRVFTVNYDGQLQAFAETTGATLWTTQLPGQYSFTSPVTASGGRVYTAGAGSGGTLYAVDQRTGAVIWTAGVANGDHSAPAVDASGVYVSYGCGLTQKFTLDGVPAWTRSTGCSGGGGKTPALRGSQVWVQETSPTDNGAVLSTSTGAVVRTFAASIFTPALGSQYGVQLTRAGTLQGINTSTGRVRWTTVGDGSLASAPVISGNIAYVGSGSGTVYGFSVTTGKQVWKGTAGAPVEAPDEQNAWMLQGLAIGGGILAVPASTRLTVFG